MSGDDFRDNQRATDRQFGTIRQPEKGRSAIEALISAYANALDSMNADLLQQIWYDDSTLDLPGFGSAGSRNEILTWRNRTGDRYHTCITGWQIR
jgi:hypothetical protein